MQHVARPIRGEREARHELARTALVKIGDVLLHEPIEERSCTEAMMRLPIRDKRDDLPIGRKALDEIEAGDRQGEDTQAPGSRARSSAR